MKTTTQLLGAVSALALVAMSSSPALAVGTTAGDTVRNDVTVTFEVGGEEQPPVVDFDTFVVDRKIDVNVNFTGVSPVGVSPGQDQAVLAFDVTNLSNDTVDLELTTILTAGTAANIENVTIYRDLNGDGVLDQAEIDAGAITFLDEVLADDGTGSQTIKVLVAADIATDAVNDDIFDIVLVADAHEAGATGLGAEITATSGADTAAVDTVLADGNGGTGEEADNDGAFSDQARFEVSGALVTVIKSSRVISDPVNNTLDGTGVDPNAKAIPGAVIEYCIAVSNAADAATAQNVNVADDLPADVTFAENDFGIFVDGTAAISGGEATCSGGTDGEGTTAIYTAGGGTGGLDEIAAALSDIPASTTRSVYFRVTIN